MERHVARASRQGIHQLKFPAADLDRGLAFCERVLDARRLRLHTQETHGAELAHGAASSWVIGN